MKKHAIIFDHDGTLVDSLDAVVLCTNQILSDNGYRPLSKAEVLEGFAFPTAERLMHHAGISDAAKGEIMAGEFYSLMHDSGIKNLKIYPGIIDALDKLAEHGYSMGMVTNNQGLFVRKTAAYLHYAYDLEIILGEENVRAPKPAPDGILQACAGLAVPPKNCWYIGDTEGDIRAAAAAGLKSGAVTWGVQSREELSGCGADALFNTPEEMVDFFIRLETKRKAS